MLDSDSFSVAGNLHLPPSSASASPPPTKRKRDDDDGGEVTPAAKRKAKKAKKAKPAEDADIDVENRINNAIGRMDNRLLADYVAQKTKRFESNLSLVELEDKHIPEKAFRDTSGWEGQRLLKDLPGFLEHYSSKSLQTKNLSTASKKRGAPHTIVITSAGLRAADVTRALRIFQTKESTVAKLFAKHIKLKEAIDFVKKTRMGIGVGTPSRLIDLSDAGALSLEKLERIVIDSSHIDLKKRGILDMKETQQPLMHFLNRPELKSRYGAVGDGIDCDLAKCSRNSWQK